MLFALPVRNGKLSDGNYVNRILNHYFGVKFFDDDGALDFKKWLEIDEITFKNIYTVNSVSFICIAPYNVQ